MTKMFYRISATIFLGILIFLGSCGKNPGEEALKAYQAEDYSTAIRLFEEARLSADNDTLFQEELSLAYMYRGKELYEKTKNIETFSGNYEKALANRPENRSPEYKKTFSNLLTELARAYTLAKPETELDKDTFFENSVNIVKQAIAEDSTNRQAKELLASIKDNHFQGMIDRAKKLYSRAGRSGDPDLYFASQAVFKQAAELDPDHKEINKYLNLILRKTMSVLNYRDDVALAITGYTHRRGKVNLNVAIKNYLPDPLNMKVENFKLLDSKGKSYPMDLNAMKQNDLLGNKMLEDSRLSSDNPLAEGNLVFNVPDTVTVDHISYQYGKKTSKKIIP